MSLKELEFFTMVAVYSIQGIPVASGQPIPVRRECKDWSKDHEGSIQVSLFIRALQKFYDLKYDEDLSYFRVAGKSLAGSCDHRLPSINRT